MIFEEDKLAIDKFGVEFPIPLYSKSRTGCELLVGEPLLENPNKVTKCSCIEHNILPPPPPVLTGSRCSLGCKTLLLRGQCKPRTV